MICFVRGRQGSPDELMASASSAPPSEKYRFAFHVNQLLTRGLGRRKETYNEFPRKIMLVRLPFNNLDIRASSQLVYDLLQGSGDRWMRFHDSVIPEYSNFQLPPLEEIFLFPRKRKERWLSIPRLRIDDGFDE